MNACGVSPVCWSHINFTSERVCFVTRCGLNRICLVWLVWVLDRFFSLAFLEFLRLWDLKYYLYMISFSLLFLTPLPAYWVILAR